MYKRILAVLDGSPRASLILADAVELAGLCGAVLHLCRAVQVTNDASADSSSLTGGGSAGAPTLTGEQHAARLLELSAGELKAAMEGLTSSTAPVARGECVCRLGAPADVVVAVADELLADVIFVGSQERDVIERLLGPNPSPTAGRIKHAATIVIRIDF